MYYSRLFFTIFLILVVMPSIFFSQSGRAASASSNTDDDLLDTVVMLIAATRKPDPSSQLLGVHVFDPAAHLAQLKDSKAQIVRLPVTWHLMEEGGSGVTAQWFWDNLDAQVVAVEQAGAKLIIEMAQTPCWASSDPNKRCSDGNYNAYLRYPPSDVNDYGKAFARLAQRYKGRVYAYEIWNEPNLVGNWPPYGPRPAAINDNDDMFIDLQAAANYAALVKASYSRLKAADPGAYVLAGAIAGGDVDYVKALYANGIKGHFDGLSTHPYTAAYPSGAHYGESYGPDECPADMGEPKFWCFQVGVERIRQAMLDAGDDKPMWFSEFGFDSNTAWNGSGLEGQAIHLQKAVNLIRGWDFVPAACWYQLVDQHSEINARENQFGLYYSNLNIKPAGTAFKALLGGSNPQPMPISPVGDITTATPVFRWQAAAGATSYLLWVNEYANPNVPGKINRTYSAAEAGCNGGGICSVSPGVTFAKASAEWWVTAITASGGRTESIGTSFVVK